MSYELSIRVMGRYMKVDEKRDKQKKKNGVREIKIMVFRVFSFLKVIKFSGLLN